MANVSGDDALLEDSLRHLLQAWSMTSEAWRDQARADFEQQHLDGIAERTREAARAVKEMDVLIGEVRRQCQ